MLMYILMGPRSGDFIRGEEVKVMLTFGLAGLVYYLVDLMVILRFVVVIMRLTAFGTRSVVN